VALFYIILHAVMLTSNDNVSLQPKLLQKSGIRERDFEVFIEQRGLRRLIPLYNKPYVTFTELSYDVLNRVLR